MRKYKKKTPGRSYAMRVKEINDIVDELSKLGIPNRTILREHIWPKYHICEKTFYNIINASADPRIISQQQELQMRLF